jgi:hypothetical protein
MTSETKKQQAIADQDGVEWIEFFGRSSYFLTLGWVPATRLQKANRFCWSFATGCSSAANLGFR